MDFPFNKCFCSMTGQIRPQHAWLRIAATHPTAAPTSGAPVLASALVPGSSAPFSSCLEHQYQLRVQSRSFLLETRTGFGNLFLLLAVCNIVSSLGGLCTQLYYF